jgi:sugar diacid utilization regulator
MESIELSAELILTNCHIQRMSNLIKTLADMVVKEAEMAEIHRQATKNLASAVSDLISEIKIIKSQIENLS